MIDDPLALTVQMIAVLAAGMYPVGFLFGVCSDCCCPACSRCTHYANGTGCRSVVSYSAAIGDYETLSSDFINDYGPGDCLDGVEPEISLDSISPLCDENSWGVGARLKFDVPVVEDDCGCLNHFWGGSVTFFFSFEDSLCEIDVETSYAEPLTCDGGTKSLEIGDPFLVDAQGVPEGCVDEFLDFVKGLEITAEIEIATCDCGACCEDGGTGVICSENVAEGGCPGEWQGVDTLCENVTCGGTCCDAATGNCTYTTEDGCDGTWTSGGSCDPNPCPEPPIGACCDGGNCTQVTQAACDELWGTWAEGVECDPNPC